MVNLIGFKKGKNDFVNLKSWKRSIKIKSGKLSKKKKKWKTNVREKWRSGRKNCFFLAKN